MTEAVRTLGQTGKTNEPALKNILIASKINRMLGGAFLSPWEVDQLPDTELDTFLALTGLQAYQAHYQKVDDIREKWRRSHPHYQTRH